MLLSELLAGVKIQNTSAEYNSALDIKSLSCSSETVGKGGLFFCLRGRNSDGHDYAHAAVAKGAAALVTERLLPVKIPQIAVESARSAMSVIAGNFYRNPIRKMNLITVTGTNGKTTTTYILKSIAEAAGFKAGLIGTTGIIIGNEALPGKLTTPDPIDLHGIFAKMYAAKCKWVIMEVSAHAIDLNKMDGVTADVAVFTNATQDHLDYFGTIERYRAAKIKYFNSNYARLAAVNVDDPTGRRILEASDIPCFTYGTQNPSDVFAVGYEAGTNGLKYVINMFDNLYDIKFRLPGRYNMYNTLAAALAASLLKVPITAVAEGIANLQTVPGRYNMIDSPKGAVFIVDYAHTPDGLDNILKSVKEFAGKRVITVFGCGGDRDRGKRPIMGRIAGLRSDYAVITSDNPRGEVPEKIIAEIEEGLRNTQCKYACVENRAEAIAHAYNTAAEGDVILIAGKGDEPYQEIAGVKIPYNDVEVIEKIIINNE